VLLELNSRGRLRRAVLTEKGILAGPLCPFLETYAFARTVSARCSIHDAALNPTVGLESHYQRGVASCRHTTFKISP